MPVPPDRPGEGRDTLPVARLTTPGEVVGSVPWIVGFEPRESLVVGALSEPRGRLGLTMRFDLPTPRGEAALAAEVARRLAHEAASRTFFVVYTGAAPGGDLPRAALAREVVAAVEAQGIDVREGLLVAGGRWWSYTCDRASCCPPEGTPVPSPGDTPSLTSLAAAAALRGRGTLPSREALGDSFRCALPAAARRRELDDAARALAADVADDEAGALTARLAWWDASVELAAEGAALGPDEAAELAVALAHVRVRDAVAVRMLDAPDALLALLLALARLTPAPYDVPVVTLLAWAAYARGDGGLANVALERVERTDPDYGLAELLGAVVDRQVPPSAVRELLELTRDELEGRTA